MEAFLNLLWLAISVVALWKAPRKSARSLLALGCVLALLFPIISASDDLLLTDHHSEEALAILVEAVILMIALMEVARVESIRHRPAAFFHVGPTDPRSPPLG